MRWLITDKTIARADFLLLIQIGGGLKSSKSEFKEDDKRVLIYNIIAKGIKVLCRVFMIHKRLKIKMRFLS